jgi:hypothetical protein
MVVVQDVLRYLLTPVEKTLKRWEAGTGLKSSIGKVFRIGSTGEGVLEGLVKLFNNYYMWLVYIAQRPWGPLYKRLFEFDMHPTKVTFAFFTHGWIFMAWFGHSFLKDTYNEKSIVQDSDFLAYYMKKYNRILPTNALNWRTSAHYIEINRIYSIEMTKKFINLLHEVYEEKERKKTLAFNS